MNSKEKEQKLVEKIGAFLTEQGKTKAVLGLSGGIDSALTLGLLVKAIGPGNIVALIMPNTRITDEKNTQDAIRLAQRLKVKAHILEINDKLKAFENLPWGQSRMAVANLNARIRALALYNYANTFDALVAGTGNKSEYYLGYFTKYGDAAADFFPIADLWKTEVRELTKSMNLGQEFLDKRPSAELWPGQEDEKELGITYAEADLLLPLIISDKKIPAGKEEQAEKLREQMLKTEHKRKQAKIITLD